MMVKNLRKNRPFESKPGRNHAHFDQMQVSPTSTNEEPYHLAWKTQTNCYGKKGIMCFEVKNLQYSKWCTMIAYIKAFDYVLTIRSKFVDTCSFTNHLTFLFHH